MAARASAAAKRSASSLSGSHWVKVYSSAEAISEPYSRPTAAAAALRESWFSPLS